MTLLVELRTLRFEQTKVAYEIGELNQKIKLDPSRKDMKSIRAKKIARVKELNEQHAALIPQIEASPYSRTDLADVINKLADIESQMVHGGIEQAHGAIRGYIDWLTADAARLDRMAAPEIQWAAAHVHNGQAYNTHHSRESAQSFVDGMNDVGADMMVVTREYTPAIYSDWKKP